MMDIGFVADDFKRRFRRNRCRPDQLFPRRLNRRWASRRNPGFDGGFGGFELHPRCRVIDGTRLEVGRWVNAPSREDLGLGVDAAPWLDDRRGGDATQSLTRSDIRGPDRAANEAHQLEVELGNDEAGSGFE